MEEVNKTTRRNFIISSLISGAAITACNKTNDFTQNTEVELTGEKVKLLSVDGEIIEIDKAYLKPVPNLPTISNEEERRGIPGKKFVMVIDLSRCKNLKKCQSACDKAHLINPGQNWLKIYPMQDAETTSPYWQPTICMHCDEPPCVKVCPVDATFKRQDGIVLIDNERCIGCRFCMAACPYSSRIFNWSGQEIPTEIASKPYSCETSLPPKMGTVSKCDFCPDMNRKGELPHCVQACPNGVFFFGDVNTDIVSNGAETFRFSEMIKEKAGYRLMEDLGTKPSVYYLPPVNRSFPFEKGLENQTNDDKSNSHIQ